MLIRSITEQDYLQATKIHNAQNEPHWHLTPEQLRLSDRAKRRGDAHYQRYVVDEEGEVIATGYLTSSWAGNSVSGRVWTGIATRADRRNTGVDAKLLEHALSKFESPLQEVWACVREDFVPMSGYLDGFTERFRSFGAELDLSTFKAAKFNPLVDKSEAEGVTVIHYSELADDPHRDEKLLTLHAKTEADAPHHEPVIPKSYPSIYDTETAKSSVFVALKDSQYIGYASFEIDDRPKTGLAFMGVLRPYRNQGIGTVLGVRVATIAESSYTELGAGGAKENVALQRVLRKLGFAIEPDWVTFAKML